MLELCCCREARYNLLTEISFRIRHVNEIRMGFIHTVQAHVP